MIDYAALGARLNGVRDRIARGAGRAGRDPASVRLVAVSKTFPADAVRAAADLGQVDFGENKVQEALQKMGATSGLPLTWHLVGHLQSNKARKAAGQCHWIHSVDDAALLTRIDEAAVEVGRPIDVLIQVDLAKEPSKHGAAPERLTGLFVAAADRRGARVRGLMLLPPAGATADASRPYFVALRKLRDRLVAQGIDPGMLAELSMGMSHDFEVAIEEGATMVRVGSAIFGPRAAV